MLYSYSKTSVEDNTLYSVIDTVTGELSISTNYDIDREQVVNRNIKELNVVKSLANINLYVLDNTLVGIIVSDKTDIQLKLSDYVKYISPNLVLSYAPIYNKTPTIILTDDLSINENSFMAYGLNFYLDITNLSDYNADKIYSTIQNNYVIILDNITRAYNNLYKELISHSIIINTPLKKYINDKAKGVLLRARQQYKTVSNIILDISNPDEISNIMLRSSTELTEYILMYYYNDYIFESNIEFKNLVSDLLSFYALRGRYQLDKILKAKDIEF